MKSRRKQLDRALLDAIVMNEARLVRELLEQGADVNARDREHGETSLMLAARFADAALVELLLSAGAELNARDDRGRNVLFFAPVSASVFKTLLDSGADVYVRDEEGDTLLTRSVSNSASLLEVEELLRLGVDASIRNNAGETAADIAEALGFIKVAERLKSSVEA
jgi:ankyrin repeat protein